jgi:hypothetical protein
MYNKRMKLLDRHAIPPTPKDNVSL